ncbi:MAG: M6 family metalloprotease domain-containing protein [Muribaculaceae bacterium]|nr:M6 family metalloprotease domain-containing protein [Muribaculaceae bacterium]
MRKLFAMMACAAMVLTASARPANRMPVVTAQPDGSSVTLRLCGDEFYHFSTTTDGYTVVKNTAGYWVYAQRNGDALQATTMVAHDADQRTAAELALLASTPRGLTDRARVNGSKRARATVQEPNRAKFDVTRFRGLIILIKPSDVNFSMGSDAQKFYNTIVNQRNMTSVGFGDYGTWTGSVRDYYYDNSMGKFDPEFDIVGPVSVNYRSNQIGNYYRSAFQSALSQVNAQVDYTKYDGDNDGMVDMVFFLVAGNTAAVQGNEELGYLWPHMSTGIGSGTYDGKRISRYACSTEMNGSVLSPFVDGIGTICHEFTHVLGFPDLYDADYADNGQAHDPGDWDIMAAGTDLNYGRTPAGYSIFERYSFGFANPKVISSEGEYTLGELSSSNEGFILRTPQNKEYFIIENRQKNTKWDRYLPGHGMLVTRVDSTNAYLWVSNMVNNYSSRMYYELLRAGNTSTGDLASDPFPGTYGVANLTNTTKPSLRNYAGKDNPYSIMGITETGGTISFNVIKAGNETTLVETFNKIPISTESPFVGTGDIADWRLAMCQMTTVEGSDRAVAMKNPSVLQMMTPIYYNIDQVTFEVNNSSGETAKIGLLYSVDNGKTWTAAKLSTGAASMSVPGQATFTAYWNVKLQNIQPAMFRITMTGGSKTAPCKIDNFTIYYTGEAGGPVGMTSDVNGDGKVDVEDVNAVINIILKSKTAADYEGECDVNNDGKIDVEDVNAIINLILKVA